MSGEMNGILTGARIQELRLEVLANNMANVSTVGFKEDRVFRIPSTPSSAEEDIPFAAPGELSLDVIASLPARYLYQL